jgi:hypothetical protein
LPTELTTPPVTKMYFGIEPRVRKGKTPAAGGAAQR